MCHLTGMVWRKIALHKGPHLKFCLTKGSLFGPKSALQKGPFLLKIEVSPLKNACFANFKRKIFRKSSESYIFRHFLLTFSKICLKTGSKFRRWRALSKGGVRDPQVAHPHTKIGEEPPRGPQIQVNHTFLGNFCFIYRKFALKQGQNFGADAPYRRVGFEILKWHTRVQKSEKGAGPRGGAHLQYVLPCVSGNTQKRILFSAWCSDLSRSEIRVYFLTK